MVALGSSGLQKMMTRVQIEHLRTELRGIVRRLAAGESPNVLLGPLEVQLFRHSLEKLGKRRSGGRQSKPPSVAGQPRDVFMYLTTWLLTSAAAHRLSVCPAPECGRAFVKVTQKRFCSTLCQSRIYMRTRRAQERAEAEAFLNAGRKGRQHGKATRPR